MAVEGRRRRAGEDDPCHLPDRLAGLPEIPTDAAGVADEVGERLDAPDAGMDSLPCGAEELRRHAREVRHLLDLFGRRDRLRVRGRIEQHPEELHAVTERRTWDRGGRSIYFRDPDGHLIELATPGVWANY